MKNIIFLFVTLLLLAPSALAQRISVQELHEKLEAGEKLLLVDVREPQEDEEYDQLGGIVVPLSIIARSEGKIAELDGHRNDEIVLYDRSGPNAQQAAVFMTNLGFTEVKALIGGLFAWIEVYGKDRFIPNIKPKPPESTPQVPKTAPEKLLFKTGAAALVEEATGWLSELIEDDEVIGTITNKWNARQDLVGKSRTQILKLLLADVKSVLTDQAALDSFVEGWNLKASPGEADKQPAKPSQ
jgi:rhodanese-related sulfurtransferase